MKRKLSKLATLFLALLIVFTTVLPASARGYGSRRSCGRWYCQLQLCTQKWNCGNACRPDCDDTLPNQPDTEQPDTPDTDQPDVPDVDVPDIDIPVEPDVPDAEEPEQPDTDAGSGSVSTLERQVVTLVNQERAANGLPALSLSVTLSDGARLKSQDMRDNRYFDHNSPTYGSPFDMMKSLGITYSAAGENIAMGYSTAEAVVNAWMNSAGHRANILSSNYTTIGVGYVDGYWTQWFTR